MQKYWLSCRHDHHPFLSLIIKELMHYKKKFQLSLKEGCTLDLSTCTCSQEELRGCLNKVRICKASIKWHVQDLKHQRLLPPSTVQVPPWVSKSWYPEDVHGHTNLLGYLGWVSSAQNILFGSRGDFHRDCRGGSICHVLWQYLPVLREHLTS